MGCLKQQTFILSVLEATNSELGFYPVGRAMLSLKALGENLFRIFLLASSVAGDPQHSLVFFGL